MEDTARALTGRIFAITAADDWGLEIYQSKRGVQIYVRITDLPPARLNHHHVGELQYPRKEKLVPEKHDRNFPHMDPPLVDWFAPSVSRSGELKGESTTGKYNLRAI